MRRRVTSGITFALLIITVVMAYMNVVSDDKAVRELAKDTVSEYAKCYAKCQISGLRGERGMIHETIEYDIAGHGHFVVQCRRKLIAIGDYACEVTEGEKGAGTGSGSGAGSAPSATPRPSH